MYLTADMLADMQARFGQPELLRAEAALETREFELLERCARTRRAHDVTLFIRVPGRGDQPSGARDDHFALIRKPSYPPEVFRPPSGGVEPCEPFETGAAREAMEETGLEIRLERYLLRIDVRFTCGGLAAPWTTHVFLADAAGGTLDPQDRKEIADARWATAGEMTAVYRPRMLAMRSAGMRYRVELQDEAIYLLGLAERQDYRILERQGEVRSHVPETLPESRYLTPST